MRKITFLVIGLAILTGTLYAVYDILRSGKRLHPVPLAEIFNRGHSWSQKQWDAMNRPANNSGQTPEAPVTTVQAPPEQPVPAPAGEDPVEKADAEKKLADARNLGAAGRFKEAADVCGDVLRLRCGPVLQKSALARMKKFMVFQELLSDVTPRTENADSTATIQLNGGKVVKGTILEKTATHVKVKLATGLVTALPRDIIERMDSLTADQMQTEVEGRYRKMLQEMGALTPIGHYQVARFCQENGMSSKAADHLEKAWALDPNLASTIQEGKAENLFKTAIWYEGMGQQKRADEQYDLLKRRHPQSRYIALIPEILGERSRLAAGPAVEPGVTARPPTPRLPRATDDEEEIIHVTGPVKVRPVPVIRTPGGDMATAPKEVSPTGPAAEIIVKANQAFSEAKDHLQKSRPDQPNYQAEGRQALAKFDEAERLFDQALQSSPGNAQIESTLDTIRYHKFWCRKMMPIK
ncbi:MAG: hypothetical protein V1809_06265 [Planctomycetota bacterium]